MIANPTPTILCQDGGSRKNKNAGDGHDWHGQPKWRDSGQQPGFLKKQKERNYFSAYADTSENGIENSLRTGLLIPTARQPEKREIR
jgi:hypothetical protein